MAESEQKKKLTEKQLDSKVRSYSFKATLFAAILFATVFIYTITGAGNTDSDQRLDADAFDRFNTLNDQIELLEESFFESRNEVEITRIDAELLVLANEQAELVQQYDLSFNPKWPPEYIPRNADTLQYEYLLNNYGLGAEPSVSNGLNYGWIVFGLLMLVVFVLLHKYVFPRLIYRLIVPRYTIEQEDEP